jgi:hypothetical protein
VYRCDAHELALCGTWFFTTSRSIGGLRDQAISRRMAHHQSTHATLATRDFITT